MSLTIDSEKLTKLIMSLYNLIHVRIVVFDENFHEVFAIPRRYSAFCESINSIPEMRGACDHCAEMMCRKCAAKGSLIVDTCHMGLTEAVTPIHENGAIIGYLMYGQFTNKRDRDALLKTVTENGRKAGVPTNDFARCLKSVQHKGDDEITSISEIINVFAKYVYLENIVSAKKDGMAFRILEYIDDNLDKDLSSSALCDVFSVSRSHLYKILSPYISGGIADHVMNKRIERAKYLLRHTEYPVDEVASMIGYYDVSYFRRVFKTKVGMPAYTYRMEHLTEIENKTSDRSDPCKIGKNIS